MLASVLRLEALLKCDLCDNLLRTTRTLKECGHRYCEDCIYDRLGEDRQCPKCHIPSIVKNLRPDPLHDTLVACIKKLKLCMIDAELPSLSLPPFDSSFNAGSGSPHQLSLDRDLSPSPDGDPVNGIVSSDSALSQHAPISQPQQQPQNTFDSDVTTQSSQLLLTQPTSHHQILHSDEYPTAQTQARQQPSPNSMDDLLLAMENEEINHDGSDHDDWTVTHSVSDNTQPPVSSSSSSSSSSGTKQPQQQQQPQHYSTTDDLLAAMESEEVMVADDDDDDDFLIPQPSALRKRMPPPTTTPLKRRCNDIVMPHQESGPKQQKTTTTAPRSPANDRPWKCASCLYGGNGTHQLVCGICRKERQEAPTTSDPTLATVPPTLDLSTSFCVPSTVPAVDTLQHEDKVIHLMSTSLSVEDNAMMDTSMAMAIDTCLKLEIYSDTRDIDNVTHLITSVNDQGLCTRTIKYLLCILTGKWVVSASWLIDSVQAGYWLPEGNYQVVGDKTSGETNGPDRGRRNENDLFYTNGDPLKFFFYGDFPDQGTKVMLLQLVRKGGGKILSRRPTLDQVDHVVVIVPSLVVLRQAKPKKSHAWLDRCRYLKDSHWLLDTIARSTLVLD